MTHLWFGCYRIFVYLPQRDVIVQDDKKNYKELMLAQKVAKKTKKRQRKLTKSLQALKVMEGT